MNHSQVMTFESDGRFVGQRDSFLVFRLSWVAYLHHAWVFVLRVLLLGGGALGLAMGLTRFTGQPEIAWLPALGIALAMTWTIYAVAMTSSVRLFTNETGVWMQSGIFPWNRGVSGVQWRDVGQAGYAQGFASWALRSYSVRISHRFTADVELNVRHLHHGNLAVEHVNSIMARLQGRVMPA